MKMLHKKTLIFAEHFFIKGSSLCFNVVFIHRLIQLLINAAEAPDKKHMYSI